jgi:peptidoglycan/xylan/chitin deacetylase (PgdA/CDA1 family)
MARPHVLKGSAHRLPMIRPGRSLFRPITRLKADGAVALTFDDGPDYGLDDLLGLMEEADAYATFFVVGEQVERAPDRIKEILSCGHEVAAHCYRHNAHWRLTPEQVVEDMRRTAEVVEEAAERPVRFFRPPYGAFTLASWLESKRQGWERVAWTRHALDWKAWATPQQVLDNLGWPQAGDIILLHDSDRYAIPGLWKTNREALPLILERISDMDLRIHSVGELLGS